MKKAICLMLLVGVWNACYAQDVMEQINAIKLKGGHLTAQYSHEFTDSAFAMGMRDILHQLIMKGYGLFTLEEIAPKVRHLDMRRGSQIRVFSYLDLSTINKKAVNGNSSERLIIQPKFEVNEVKDNTPRYDKVVPTPPIVTSPSNNNLVNDPETSLARDIMAQQDINAAMNILKAKKNAGIILSYGPFAKGTNIDKVYVAIFDRTTSAPMAVLSPTKGAIRKNLLTKADDSLSNYHGCKAIWISF